MLHGVCKESDMNACACARTHTHTHNRLTANIMFSGDKLKAFLLRKDQEQNKIVVTHSHHIFIYLFSFGM